MTHFTRNQDCTSLSLWLCIIAESLALGNRAVETIANLRLQRSTFKEAARCSRSSIAMDSAQQCGAPLSVLCLSSLPTTLFVGCKNAKLLYTHYTQKGRKRAYKKGEEITKGELRGDDDDDDKGDGAALVEITIAKSGMMTRAIPFLSSYYSHIRTLVGTRHN